MGLAGTRVKQKFSYDPRNTKWANNTDRFGHQYLEKLGWKPGKGLGLVSHAVTTHVKVAHKDDTVGLGSKLAKKQKKDEFDSGECAGLDVFQRILGRLNGREDEIQKELEIQRQEKLVGKFGIVFVKGDILKSTWDSEAKKLIAKSEEKTQKKETKDKKDKKETKDKKDKKDKKRSRSQDDEEDEKLSKKSKKEKKEKKEKKVKKEKSKDKEQKKDKKEKKEKKEKKDKKSKKSKKEEVTRESMLRPNESREESPAITTRLSVRSRWIKQKRAATLDAKALNEIFMITN